MVDFRYHLVSLISVFIALALGVVLGAGPLQEPIANGLTGQVEALKENQAQNILEIEKAHSDIAQRNEWIFDTARATLAGSLKDRKVALVTFPGARQTDIDDLRSLIETAGGAINQRATLTADWANKKQTEYRIELANTLAPELTNKLADTANSGDVLGHALVESLTLDTPEAVALREKLAGAETTLVEFDQASNVTSDTILVLGAPAEAVVKPAENAVTPQDKKAKTNASAKGADIAALTGLANAVVLAPNWGVVLGDGESEKGLVAVLRNASVKVTTVDSAGTTMGNTSAILALVNAKDKNLKIGFAPSAQQVIPELHTQAK
ncbi:hypothetical protein HMPREF0044_0475 [Gleimia coleocanis DSM 15436]|uniref:Copper transporter n=1 Tax=Gleimia coleocanis DSM 15436 TaxID=525245 RepID=C0VZ85_9ACTO|nr:copper transporter [Gleimia coleocanis]EEH64186.1 hypothetical protein HMPREF0044_0475 [Gleimia coleocanis DSM 15436]